jgi:hypothetical protein
MTIVVFAGPSLPPAAHRILDATYLPPAARGDVYRAANDGATAIALIDGYFDQVPAVWHKEILWALSRNIPVFGAASMGALRAAELAAFGMVGVGPIYEAVVSGEVDDDDVAIAHAAEEHQFRALSDALVDMRATFRAAKACGIIGASTLERLETCAKRLFYPDRSYRTVLDAMGPSSSATNAEFEALRQWLPKNRVNQKRADALLLLKHVEALQNGGFRNKPMNFVFSNTDAWLELCSSVDTSSKAATAANALHAELGLDHSAAATRTSALTRAWAVKAATDALRRPSREMVRATAEAFRREKGLLERAAFEAWLEKHDLETQREIDEFFEREAIVRSRAQPNDRLLHEALVDHLRVSGQYASLPSYLRAVRSPRVAE